jgi:alpha-mannosidase
MGLHRFTYVLLPHYGPYNYAGIVQASYALNAPLRSTFLDPAPGISGALPPFVHCDDRNIVIETVKKSEDGGDLIVRVYECHNARGSAELSCIRQPRAAALCDLEENPIADLEVTDGQVRFNYKPFEIITIRLKV